MKIRLIELFAGIGSQAKALENLKIPFETHRMIEFDKYAVCSYNAVHDTNFGVSDVTKITGSDLGIEDTENYMYIMTYSFPCQDLSLAGKQKGMTKNSGTRSGLLWEVERLLNECSELPQVLLMENVPQVHAEKNKADFYKWIDFLESKGYANHYKDLNAKNYGIPQNRERCFMVSVLQNGQIKEYPQENFLYRKYYEFPEPFTLKLKLKDMLEDNVDKKYYLGDIKDWFVQHTFDMQKAGNGFSFEPHVEKHANIARSVTTRAEARMDDNFIAEVDIDEEKIDFRKQTAFLKDKGKTFEKYTNITTTLLARDYKGVSNQRMNCVIESRCVQLGNLTGGKWDKITENCRRVYSPNGLSPTLHTCAGGNTEPKIMVKEATKKGYAVAEIGDSINLEQPNSETRRGRVGKGIAQTIMTSPEQAVIEPIDYKIRKLTPLECWRLMGFSDHDFEKARAALNETFYNGADRSTSQLYKQAGNSIVVNVLMAIFQKLIERFI